MKISSFYFFMIIGTFVVSCGCSISHKITDQDLIVLFRNHRSDFEKLKVMAIEDAGRIGYINESSLRQSALSEGRKSDYSNLLSSISPSATLGTGAHQVTFHISQGGAVLAIGRSWTKGIAYLPGGAKGCTLVKSLDELGSQINDGVYVVPIEGDWYLIYSQLD